MQNSSVVHSVQYIYSLFSKKVYFTYGYFVVPQDFNKIVQYISHCYYLSMNDTLLRTDNCSVKQDYKCTSGKHFLSNNTNQISSSIAAICLVRISSEHVSIRDTLRTLCFGSCFCMLFYLLPYACMILCLAIC